MISGTALACVLTVVVGCYVLLHLTGKALEIDEKDRRIRQWTEDRLAEKKAKVEQTAPSATSKGAEPKPHLATANEQPEPVKPM